MEIVPELVSVVDFGVGQLQLVKVNSLVQTLQYAGKVSTICMSIVYTHIKIAFLTPI